jgi:hypothetical protein
MQKMVTKKTWVKSRKQRIINCGTCLMCDRVLMSDEGGWIVNANKDYFCENYRANEHSCFDEYLKQKKEWDQLNR